MCLYIYTYIRLPVGIGNLVSLEELSIVPVGGIDVIKKELGKLVELRVLGLQWIGDNETACNSLLVSLENLQKLHKLSIYSNGGARSLDVIWDTLVPPPHLHTLVFHRCTLTLPRWINSSSFPVLSRLDVEVDRVRPEVDI